jgi:hypothetical protein
MRTLRCPRCNASVTVAPGATPVCSQCGYGKAPPGTAASAGAASAAKRTPPGPVAGQPDNAGAPPGAHGEEPPPRSGPRVLLVTFLVVLLLASAAAAVLWATGILSSDPPPSSEEAARTAEMAFRNFNADISSPQGNVTNFTLRGRTSEGPMAASIHFEMERGVASMRLLVSVQADVPEDAPPGSPTFAIKNEVICAPGGFATRVDEEWLIARPQPCDDLTLSEIAPFAGSPLANLEQAVNSAPMDLDVRARTATYSAPEGGTYTIHYDAKGRLVRVDQDTPGGTGTLTVSYEPRRAIALPEGERIPAELRGNGEWRSNTYVYRMQASRTYPIDEFELRIAERGLPVATMPFANGTSGNFTLVMHDGDGIWQEGDGFDLTAEREYEIIVWDKWANRDVRDIPLRRR